MIKKLLLFAALLWGVPPVPGAAAPWQAPEQAKAEKRAHEKVEFVEEYKEEVSILRSVRLHEQGLSVKDIEHSYTLLDSPIIKEREDHYGPVRFTHGQHAASIGDCSVCHHVRPEDSDMSETVRCSACHREAFHPEYPERIGLKAAYHLQCMGCHEQQNAGPVGCRDCHLNNVPDHEELIELPESPEPGQVTRECLRCHEEQGQEMLASAHWLWKGPSLYTAQHIKEIQRGKGTTALNNY